MHIQIAYVLSASGFAWNFRKIPFTFGIFFIKIGKISAKIHEIGKIKAIYRLGMNPKWPKKITECLKVLTDSLQNDFHNDKII